MAVAARQITRRSQAERSADTTTRLIDATISLLHEHGYAATSTTLVAERAGVSRGAMLHHFPTKVQLMAATVYATFESDVAAYMQAIRVAVQQKKVVGMNTIIDAAWECFNAPSGVAQAQIWLATQSDPELAAVVLPAHEAIRVRSIERISQILTPILANDQFSIRQILIYSVSSLRGLALERVLGTPMADLDKCVELLKLTVATLMRDGNSPTPVS